MQRARPMAAKKPCNRCGRLIDDWARICPFCNADQAAAPEEVEHVTAATTEIPVRKKRNPGDFFRTVPGRLVLAFGVVLLLGGAFAVGMFVYSMGAPSRTGRPQQTAGPAPITGVTEEVDGAPGGLVLVPTEAATTFEQNAPPASGEDPPSAAEQFRTDATALAAEVYARLSRAERARQQQQEREREQAAAADPRTIEAPPAWAAAGRADNTPPAPQKAPPPREPAQKKPPSREEQREASARDVRRTPPVPTSQPIPDVSSVSASGTVRLTLTVDERGRVREVEIVQGVPGITAKLIDSVRRWRFRPATENGRPVQGVFPVEVSFNAGD